MEPFRTRLRNRRLALWGGATAAVISLALASPAHAINRYTILANSPKPAACQNSGTIAAGTWMQNKVCGYFIGTALAGSAFDVHETAASDYHYGRDYGSNNLCAWIPPGALSANPTGTADPSCSDAIKSAISHRRAVGYDFNAKPHEATDGSEITVNPACGAFYNYYSDSTYANGALRDAAGTPGSEVFYRFTANGGHGMVVRDATLGWVFMDRGCVTDWKGVDQLFNNDDD
jgi:hypothetical protein